MKCRVINHSELSQFDRIIDFIYEAELLYNKKPTSKEAHLNLLNLFFNEESAFIIVHDKDDRILACASISTDNNYSEIGFIGHYHLPINLINRAEVKHLFFKFITSYCSNLSLSNIIGPINFNTWLANRFIYPVPEKIHYWEPNNPTQYPEDFIDEGFEVDKKYYSYFLPNTTEADVMKPAHEHILAKGYRMTPVEINNLAHQKILYELNCECFSENYFYREISFEQYQKSLIKTIVGMDFSLSCFIETNERKWGYIFNIPDQESIVIKTIIVSPLARTNGLGSAMIYQKIIEARSKGFTKATGALIREGNASQRFFKKDSSPYKINEYLLFKKALK